MYTVEEKSLVNIADSIRKKAKKTGTLTFPSGFVSAIDGIETGGGSTPAVIEEVKEKDVNFYDYDGLRVFSYTAAESAALTALPTPSARSGLTFQGWNWTLDEVKAAAAADIGAHYATTDGKTRLYIKVDNQARKDILLNVWQNKAGAISVDWGDGNTSEPIATAGDIQFSHEYSESGEYTISLSVIEGASAGLGHDYPYGQLFSGAGANPDADTYKSNVYTNMLVKAEIGDRVTVLNAHCFDGCENLESVNMPTTLTSIRTSALCDCRRLQWVTAMHAASVYSYAYTENGFKRATLGGGQFSTGGSYTFQKDHNLQRAVYPSHITMIQEYEFYDCTALSEVICLGNIKTVKNMAFSGDYSLKRISFLNCTAVPSLASYRAFEKTSADLEILVPASLVDDWKAATNWSTYADNIKGV